MIRNRRNAQVRLGWTVIALCTGCAYPAARSSHVLTNRSVPPAYVTASPVPRDRELFVADSDRPLISNEASTSQVVPVSLIQTAAVDPSGAGQTQPTRDTKLDQVTESTKSSELSTTPSTALPSNASGASAGEATTFPIDLPTALRLGEADNLQVALAREQIQQSYAEYSQAGVMWLPSLRSGVHYNKHEGPLLSSSGDIRDTSRGSLYAGAGAAAVGGGSPAIPGVLVNFHLADALFQPLALQQRWGARENAASATRNDTLLNVSIAYLELLRASEDLAIVTDVRDKVQELSRLTDAYVKAGQGLLADADRMKVELGMRELEVRRANEGVALASTRLAQLLRLQACCRLTPMEPTVVELKIIEDNCDCCTLVTQALQNRPELRQSKYLVGEAVERLRRERYAPLVPSVLLGASYGGFGGGQGSRIGNFDDRMDFDASAFWEVRNLGLGEEAAQKTARSRIRQAQLQELSVMDQVAREVTEAHAQVTLRKDQIETAKQLVKYANESYEQNVLRTKHAQGLPIETLQAVQALLQSRRELLRTITDYNSAQFTLRRATGWM